MTCRDTGLMKKVGKILGVLFLVILSVAYVGTGLSRISVDVDILRLLPTKLKQVEGLSLFLKHFAIKSIDDYQFF